MTDDIDAANEVAALMNEAAIQQRKAEAPDPRGICLNCNTRLDHGRRWCDAQCRDAWEKEQQNGN